MRQPEDERGGASWVLVAAAVVVAMLGSATWLLRTATAGPVPRFLTEVPASDRRSPSDDALVIAGSGSNLPVTRALATAWALQGSPPPVVHTSVGSGGGMRALADGAIDIALISRPLNARERSGDLTAVPYARAPVVFAVHTSVPDRDIDAQGVLDIYAGRRTTWADGTPIVVLQRERGDSSHAAAAKVIPGFAEVDEEAWSARRWRVIYDDVGMQEALASTEGSIGLVGSGTMPPDLAVRGLSFAGVEGTAEAVVAGHYPLFKDLAFVTRNPPDERATQLFRFVYSAEGRRVIVDHGCAPLGETPPGGA